MQLAALCLLVTLAIVCAVSQVLVAQAQANDFTVYSCHTPSGSVTGIYGWQQEKPGGLFLELNDSCGEAGAGALTGELPGRVGGYGNEDVQWTFHAPSWTAIAQYKLVLPSNYTRPSEGAGEGTVFIEPSDKSDPYYDWRALGAGSVGEVVDERTPPDEVHFIIVGAGCDTFRGACPGPVRIASVELSAATLLLTDNTAPRVTGLTGSLVSGQTLSGTANVSFEASDPSGPGVYAAHFVLDGAAQPSVPLDQGQPSCQNLAAGGGGPRAFDSPEPCASTLDSTLDLETSALSGGQHSLELVVEDAAGNQTIAYDGTITVAGSAVTGVGGQPGGGLAAPRIPNGESPCAGEAIDLTVNGKSKPPAVLYGKPVTIKGVLHCGTVPIRGARVAVETLGGPPSAQIATAVQTGLDGSFSFAVPTGPDRTLRFSYTAYSTDPGPSASATVAVRIRPKIKLTIRPRATFNGQWIGYAGTIVGGPYPARGVTLDVEVREGRRWRIFEQVLAGRKGRFHYRYRFHATTEPTTYVFRVALPANGAQGYEYASGASNRVAVRVAP